MLDVALTLILPLMVIKVNHVIPGKEARIALSPL